MDRSELLQLSLGTLAELDFGRANEAFNSCLRRAVNDIIDRPADPTARKVMLQFSIVPILEPGGDCTEVEVEIDCQSKTPVYRTKKLSLGVRRGGVLAFRPDAPDNVNQTTMNMGDED